MKVQDRRAEALPASFLVPSCLLSKNPGPAGRRGNAPDAKATDGGAVRPWMLKQVQHDGRGGRRFWGNRIGAASSMRVPASRIDMLQPPRPDLADARPGF